MFASALFLAAFASGHAQVLTPSKSLPPTQSASPAVPESETPPPRASDATAAPDSSSSPTANQIPAAVARDAQGRIAIPTLGGRVVDTLGLLGASTRHDFEARFEALERRSGSQLVLLVVATTAPETIEQFAVRVFDTWRIGRGGTDDGVLLLIAQADRRARIEVGRGLEGAIPDAIANRVIDAYLVPRFREGDFAGGIDATTSALIRLIDGETLPAVDRRSAGRDDAAWGFLPAVIVAVVLGSLFGFLRGRNRAVTTGLANGAVGWLVAGLGAALTWVLIGVVVGAMLSLFRGGGGRMARGSGWGSFGGMPGIGGGGFGGRGRGGGGFGGGGGFSGGGGMSAGGGASGSW